MIVVASDWRGVSSKYTRNETLLVSFLASVLLFSQIKFLVQFPNLISNWFLQEFLTLPNFPTLQILEFREIRRKRSHEWKCDRFPIT